MLGLILDYSYKVGETTINFSKTAFNVSYDFLVAIGKIAQDKIYKGDLESDEDTYFDDIPPVTGFYHMDRDVKGYNLGQFVADRDGIEYWESNAGGILPIYE